jgi:hypothetical protein
MVDRTKPSYVLIFLANSPPQPWPCHFCGEDVSLLFRARSESMRRQLVVHHLNHDEEDNDLSNLVPCHFGCHTSHHGRGNRHGVGNRGPTRSAHRELLRERALERARDGILEWNRVTKRCVCGKQMRASNMVMHLRASGHSHAIDISGV